MFWLYAKRSGESRCLLNIVPSVQLPISIFLFYAQVISFTMNAFQLHRIAQREKNERRLDGSILDTLSEPARNKYLIIQKKWEKCAISVMLK
jgi:hypothetical protein